MEISDIMQNIYRIKNFNGLNVEEIRFLEERYHQLPEVLKDFYVKYGNCQEIFYIQDVWIMPDNYKKWKWLNEKKDFILLNENQGVCYAAIREKDLGCCNPKVYVTDDDGKTWKVCAESVEVFIKATLVYEGIFGFRYSSEAFYWINGEEFKMIEKMLHKYPFEITNWVTPGYIRLYYLYLRTIRFASLADA